MVLASVPVQPNDWPLRQSSPAPPCQLNSSPFSASPYGHIIPTGPAPIPTYHFTPMVAPQVNRHHQSGGLVAPAPVYHAERRASIDQSKPDVIHRWRVESIPEWRGDHTRSSETGRGSDERDLGCAFTASASHLPKPS